MKKMTKKKLAEHREAHVEYNKRQKRERLGEPVTFEHYLNMIQGRIKITLNSNEIPTYDRPKRQADLLPSLQTFKNCNTEKKEPQKYSGERKLVGIGTMHKSNMVPIFSDDEAEDIAKMRRN